MMGGQSLRRNRLRKAYFEVDENELTRHCTSKCRFGTEIGHKRACRFYENYYYYYYDRLCGLVVRVPGYRYKGPDSIPDATRFSDK
jgi:hypothetical protein